MKCYKEKLASVAQSVKRLAMGLMNRVKVKSKVKISLFQAVEAHRVARG
jgi:hypothetical protein